MSMNSVAQHSPAPWVLEDRGYKLIVSKPGDGYITRDVCRMDASTMSAFNQAANARLIAAAPEMLAALELVECVYRKNVVAEGEPSSVLDELQRVIRKARASCTPSGAQPVENPPV